MRTRLDLQTKLEELLGSEYVYYQPPASVQLIYPAIVYEKSDIRSNYANNAGYISHDFYDITVIDKRPDNPVIRKILSLPGARFNRHFKADNLNHDVIKLYL